MLSATRIALAPALLWLAWTGCQNAFVILLIIVLLTDLLDGWLARRLNCQTELGAKLDSWGDFILWVSLPFCAWWLNEENFRNELPFLAVAIFFYLAAVGIGFLKFKKLTSYHTYGAKIMTVLASVAVIFFFASGSGMALRIFVPIVVVAQVEEILITLSLPKWRANVPSIWHLKKSVKRAASPK